MDKSAVMKLCFLIMFIFEIVMCSGCSSAKIYRMYAGPQMPVTKISYLYPDTGINIISVDGIKLSANSGVELAPGSHKVVVGYCMSTYAYNSTHVVTGEPVELEFVAEVQYSYLIKNKMSEKKWSPYVVQGKKLI